MANQKDDSIVAARREWRRRLNESAKKSNRAHFNVKGQNDRKGENRIFLGGRISHHAFSRNNRAAGNH
jgi:hypothetical protein